MVIAETERLILRHFNSFDGEAMDRVFGDAEVMHYGDGLKTREWVRQWLRENLPKKKLETLDEKRAWHTKNFKRVRIRRSLFQRALGAFDER